MLILLFNILPTGIISRATGILCRIPLPRWMMRRFIGWYCRAYGVATDEILEPIENFATIDDFFTRRLKPGIHRIDRGAKTVVSPVDARIVHFGAIEETSILQAKGIRYTLADLIPGERYQDFINGSFITLYLAPGDYHRIHAPVSGRVSGYMAIPGKLFPVKEFAVNGIPGLFSKNERLISFIETAKGKVAVCKIGAMNVGRITLSCDDSIATNQPFKKRYECQYLPGDSVKINKGDEMGAFHMGSTIILLFQKGMVSFKGIRENSRIRVGEPLAVYKK